ncbi:MAG: hypothetical protein V3V52_01085 [Candidatus Adiutricales bacterium]
MTDVVANVLVNVGYLLVYIGIFVLLVNIGAAIKAIGGQGSAEEERPTSPY